MYVPVLQQEMHESTVLDCDKSKTWIAALSPLQFRIHT